jgi:hypothetical protein
VDDVGLALVAPLSRQDTGHSYATERIAATSQVFPPAKYRPVTPGYFGAVGTRLHAGRRFDWAYLHEERLVTIVDEKLAGKAWPGENPIGKRLRIEVWSTRNSGRIHLEPLWTEVVGVVENARSLHLGREDLETIYLPYNLYAHWLPGWRTIACISGNWHHCSTPTWTGWWTGIPRNTPGDGSRPSFASVTAPQ